LPSAEVVPGFRADAVNSNGTVTAASACGIGSYNPGYEGGVTCVTCPWGTTTMTDEATKPSDCSECAGGMGGGALILYFFFHSIYALALMSVFNDRKGHVIQLACHGLGRRGGG
jgi:hypothetical protein